MKLILHENGLPKETIIVILTFHKSMKGIICSSDGDTNDFSIVVRVLQWNKLAPSQFIVSLDNILRTAIN